MEELLAVWTSCAQSLGVRSWGLRNKGMGRRKIESFLSYFILVIKVGVGCVNLSFLKQVIVDIWLGVVCMVPERDKMVVEAAEVVDGVEVSLGVKGKDWGVEGGGEEEVGEGLRRGGRRVKVVTVVFYGRLISDLVDNGWFLDYLEGLNAGVVWLMEVNVFDRFVGKYGLG